MEEILKQLTEASEKNFELIKQLSVLSNQLVDRLLTLEQRIIQLEMTVSKME
jgi:hypothetical protein